VAPLALWWDGSARADVAWYGAAEAPAVRVGGVAAGVSDVLASAAMPIYEYRCTACEKEFEYQQRMADDPKTVCEACSGKLERILSRSSFHLKGGGWYKDLYASTKPGDGGGERWR
jgi:putative FmdB family regulatory protein